MREIPILFNGPMVRALRAGLKTQTRRLRGLEHINESPDDWAPPIFDPTDGKWVFTRERGLAEQVRIRCPYGVPGDHLWIRETWCEFYASSRSGIHETGLRYKANGGERIIRVDSQRFGGRLTSEGRIAWRPSIHMPRWASRITLEVTGVRCERIQVISEADAIAEGVCDIPDCRFGTTGKVHREMFAQLWDSINVKRGYGVRLNPWVWPISFKVLDGGAR